MPIEPTRPTLRILIDTGNVAFDENPALELAAILRNLSAELMEGSTLDEFTEGKTLRGHNGNIVGRAQFVAERVR